MQGALGKNAYDSALCGVCASVDSTSLGDQKLAGHSGLLSSFYSSTPVVCGAMQLFVNTGDLLWLHEKRV